MNIAELMGLFSNPETIKNLSGGDRMMGVGVTVILGMGITVLALIFIMFLIGFMTKLLAEKPKTAEPVESVTPVQKVPAKIDPNDAELMAAISAAVAEKMGISQKSIVKTVIESK